MKQITIGTPDVKLDIIRLIISRLLCTADSGGGKSYLLRKILEQVSKYVQTIVIDTEGEFATLRELRDMVLAGPGGECPAEPRSAALLCRRLMELNLSAVIDISELTPREKQEFVANFCNAMVDLPRALWHYCIVAIDELHEFAPEGESSESEEAVSRLASKGRKRGFGLIGATQRLSKLSKNAAAGLKNQLYGTFSLDADIQRAAKSLGFARDRWPEIRDLSSQKGHEGEFFAFGPAFNHRGVKKMRTTTVETTHPEAGVGRMPKPPEPSQKIKAVLDEFKDLPGEAEAEIKDLVAARSRIAELERDLRRAISQANHTKPAPAQKVKRVEIPVLKSAQLSHLDKALNRFAGMIDKLDATRGDLKQRADAIESAIKQARKEGEAPAAASQPDTVTTSPGSTDADTDDSGRLDKQFTEYDDLDDSRGSSNGSLSKGERIILVASAQHPSGVDRVQLSVLSGYKKSTRNRLIQYLQQKGYIEERGELLFVTKPGVAALGDFKPLPTGTRLREYYLGDRSKLREGERRILQELVKAYPSAIDRESLDEPTGYKKSTRNRLIQYLQARKLVDDSGKGIKASATLFD